MSERTIRIDRRAFVGGLGGALSVLLGSGCSSHDSVREDLPDPLERLQPSGREPDVVRVGVPPTNGHSTAALFDPLVRYLAAERGIQAVVSTADTYEAVARLLETGELDAAFFSPLAYVKARATLPAAPVATAARAGSPTYIGYLVVRDDDPAEQLSDLAGKRIGYVERTSASGYLYPRALLRSRGLSPDTFFREPLFLGDHRAVIAAVARREIDVGATASPFVDPDIVERIAEADQIKVVAKTSRIPLDCAVVHHGISRALGTKWRDALLGVVDSLSTSDALSRSWGVSGFVTAEERHYDEIARVLEEETSG